MEGKRIGRRPRLRRIAGAASVCAVGNLIVRGDSQAPARPSGSPEGDPISINVLLNESIGTIRPALYGQFAEHFGGVIYDGIWVGPDSKVPEHRRHPPVAGRACPSPGADRHPLAGWLLRRRLPLARRNRTAGKASPAFRPLAGRHRVEPVRHARVSAVLPAVRRRAVSRRQRRDGKSRRVPAVGRILQCSGRQNDRWPTSAWPTATASRLAFAIGASGTRAGAAAASSRRRITARSTASSPNGCPITASLST